MLRVARGSDPNTDFLRVVAYSNGAVRTEHAFARGARGVVVHIWSEKQLTEMKALPNDFNAAALADALLLTSNVDFSALSECSILKRLAELAFPLRFRLRAVMHACGQNAWSPSIEYARLIGGRTIIFSARYDDDVLRATALDLAARLHDSLRIGNDARPFDTDGVLDGPSTALRVAAGERRQTATTSESSADSTPRACLTKPTMTIICVRTGSWFSMRKPDKATAIAVGRHERRPSHALTRVLVIGDDERDPSQTESESKRISYTGRRVQKRGPRHAGRVPNGTRRRCDRARPRTRGATCRAPCCAPSTT